MPADRTSSAVGAPGDTATGSVPGQRTTLPPEVLDEMRRTRRHPRVTQFDYLHLMRLLQDIREALDSVTPPPQDVLDVFCGTRPYEDLLPEGARCTGMDIDNFYGAADVVSTDLVPFGNDSFDLVMSIEAFHFAPDPDQAIADMRRVLRPGGHVLVTIPFAWEYDRTTLEHRYTAPELAALFSDWEEVHIVENGGRGVSWAILTNRIIALAREGLPRPTRRFADPIFSLLFAAVNLVGAGIERLDRRLVRGVHRWPMNLLLLARKPATAQP